MGALVEKLLDDADVELGGVDGFVLEWKTHQRDTDLVMHAGVDDGFPGLGQIVDVVHVIEVAIPGGSVPGHQLCLEIQRVEALGGEGDPGDRTGQDLEVDIGADRIAHAVHALERILTDVEEWRLVTGAATKLEVADAGLLRRELHGRQDVCKPHLSAKRAL